jgi:hypothetical protein
MHIKDRIAVLDAVCKTISLPITDDRLNQLEMIYRKAISLVSEEPVFQVTHLLKDTTEQHHQD